MLSSWRHVPSHLTPCRSRWGAILKHSSCMILVCSPRKPAASVSSYNLTAATMLLIWSSIPLMQDVAIFWIFFFHWISFLFFFCLKPYIWLVIISSCCYLGSNFLIRHLDERNDVNFVHCIVSNLSSIIVVGHAIHQWKWSC